jgi:hypothetical protein
VIRFATAAVICAVAAFAAVVSYSHIYGLGRAHGQDGTAARIHSGVAGVGLEVDAPVSVVMAGMRRDP